MINYRIQEWFDKGLFEQALLGDESFRIPDITFRECHDRILVIRQLFIWAKKNKSEVLDRKIWEIIYKIIINRFEDGIEILLSYFIVKKDFDNVLDIDTETLKNVLKSKIKENAHVISQNEQLRNKLIRLNDYIQGLY